MLSRMKEILQRLDLALGECIQRIHSANLVNYNLNTSHTIDLSLQEMVTIRKWIQKLISQLK